MKKLVFGLMGILILTGCSSREIEGSISVDNDEAIYAYIEGSGKNIESLEAKTSDGTIFKGELDKNDFQIAIPFLGVEQNVVVTFKNEDGTLDKDVTIDAKKEIDSYENFSYMMNTVISSINADAKTSFPESVDDGFMDVANENGVTTTVNVYDGNIIGLEMRTEGDVNQELPTILAAFQGTYEAENKRVAEAYNNILDTKEETSFTSNGYVFNFEYNGDTLFADIYKK
ncbi:hypothetical protein [Enterococcus sp. SMC-9]|uniref:hypothetical protein n=1 Tax=Enterococcus sp. SMC-9 TaxID=2862343 RepID=UPI001E4680B8|nr:hypothetical protein [Enterococcus sp. SMC-9]MCD1025790.1 hypothetical protein [Enterococcus sp. SMC-9]